MALTIGTMVGVAVMWLIAPMTGEETRRVLKGNLADVQGRANLVIEDVQEKARRITDIGRRVVEEQKTSLERGAEELKSVKNAS